MPVLSEEQIEITKVESSAIFKEACESHVQERRDEILEGCYKKKMTEEDDEDEDQMNEEDESEESDEDESDEDESEDK